MSNALQHMPSKEVSVKNATILSAYLLVVWGFYRFIFKLPEEVEDFLIKPALWLIPVFWLINKEKSKLTSVGITFKNLFQSIYLSLALGVFFVFVGVLTNLAKYQSINFTDDIGGTSFMTALLLSLATGVTEEITFRGYIFNRVWHGLGDEWKANYIVSIVWALVHIPVALLWWKMDLPGTVGILILITMFGIGSSYIFARTKNVASSILLHMLWSWPIILFR